MKKRLLALLCTVALVAGLLPATVYATKPTVIFTADSQTWKYDGQTHYKKTYQKYGLIPNDVDVVTFSNDSVITDAGEVANKIESVTIYRNGNDVTDQYNIEKNEGTLKVAPREVTITSGSAKKPYDGTPLKKNSTQISGGDGFIAGEGYTANVTGSQLTGSGKNTFTINFAEGTKAKNYKITKVEGDLEVTPIPITITTDSDSKMYNGTPLTNDGYDITSGQLASGDELEVPVIGSITDAGSVYNMTDAITIKNAKGVDVTAGYDIDLNYGTLTVTKRQLTLTSASAYKEYDGTVLTAEEVIVGGDGFGLGDGAQFDFEGERLQVGSSKNLFTFKLNKGTNPDNYEITAKYGMLTVAKNTTPITIAVNSDSKVYDGTPLTNDGFEVEGGEIFAVDELQVDIDGEITDAGETANTGKSYKVVDSEGNDVTSFYTFAGINDGVLTVEQSPEMTITASESDTWLYSDEVHYGEATSNIDDGNTLIEFSVDGGETWGQDQPAFNLPGTYNVIARATNKNYVTVTAEFTFTINEGPKAGFAKDHGVWGYYRDGKLTTANGFFTDIDRFNETGKTYRYHVVDGLIDFSFNEMAENGNLRYYENGRWMVETTGAVKAGDSYYYVERGVLNAKYEGLAKVDGVWRYFKNGEWQKSTSGFVTDKNRTNQVYRYRILNGNVDFTFTGAGESNNGRYYKNGRWMNTFTGKATIDGSKVNVKAGYIQ